MAPTSSILPIRDAIAERRLYFGILGLLLILVDGLNRLPVNPKLLALACVLLLAGAAAATESRAHVWSDATSLWENTVRKSPNKARAHFELGNAYFSQRRCGLAEAEFRKAAQLQAADYPLLVDWGLASDCLNRPGEALAKLRQAAALQATSHVYSQMGMIYGKQQRWAEALDALATAEKLDPNFYLTYFYRGGVHLFTNQPEAAVRDYQRALALHPNYQPAEQGLSMAQSRLSAGRR